MALKILETKENPQVRAQEAASNLEDILAFWEDDPAFEMPDWYEEGWEPSN